MPIDIIARDAEGHLTKAFRLGDRRGNYILSNLSDVEGEMPEDDFFHGAGLPFFANFRLSGRHAYISEEYRHIKERVANMASKIITGPYYIHEVKEGNMATLVVLVLQKRDIKEFASFFPDWVHDTAIEADNHATALERHAEGWRATCSRLKHWMAGIVSGPHRNGVPCHHMERHSVLH